MKKTITKIALFFGVVAAIAGQAQVTVENFDSYTLTPNSYYKNTTTPDWQTSQATFRYTWSASFGGYWETGSSYTNVKDTIDGTGSGNALYSNITGSGFSGDNYVTVQDKAIIKVKNLSALSGFFVTNTTFAWKAVKKGNTYSRRFGDTTGTGSGTSIVQGNYPDWFLLSVVGFRNGTPANDTVKFYLADYRAAGTANDYVIKNWQFVNCTALGIVDSVQFHMSSSDNSFGFMNTPAFFSIDNFTTNTTVGINELENVSRISLFPNPTNDNVSIHYVSTKETNVTIRIYDISGKEVVRTQHQNNTGENNIKLETSALEAGAYFVELSDGVASKKIKFIKL